MNNPKKAAIIYPRNKRQYKQKYWNEEIINQWSSRLCMNEIKTNYKDASKDSTNNNPNNSNEINESVEISYESFTIGTAYIAEYIDKKYIQPTNSSSYKICITIPQGPFLPSSVIAIHALQLLSLFQSQQTIILIPMDCDDVSYDRLHYMIYDARPDLILCMDHRYEGNLNLVLENINYNPTVVDILSIFKDKLNTPNEVYMNSILSTYKLYNPFTTNFPNNRISHIVYTSGTTSNKPKGCVSSIYSLLNYIKAKVSSHEINSTSVVLLCSSLSFDPCFSDILSTFAIQATLALTNTSFHIMAESCKLSHVLCTPSYFSIQILPKHHCIKVIALGGESLSMSTIHGYNTCFWKDTKLIGTYGVTEACVYQTYGVIEDITRNYHVGIPMHGNSVRICQQSKDIIDVNEGDVGEVILHGNQIDKFTSYHNLPDLTSTKFIFQHDTYYYRTGDLGYIKNNKLYIIGRIDGEENMIKINGIRMELTEIENVIMNNTIDYCCTTKRKINFDNIELIQHCLITYINNELLAYIILPNQVLQELSISSFPTIMPSSHPLIQYLKYKCKYHLKKGCFIPKHFIIIKSVPLSHTGKLNKKNLPSLNDCSIVSTSTQDKVLLESYGNSGSIVSAIISQTLNIPENTIYSSSNFVLIGGDSLSATRIVRYLYTKHYDLQDGRMVGGAYGDLQNDIFNVRHLVKRNTLGDYIDFLDGFHVCSNDTTTQFVENEEQSVRILNEQNHDVEELLYNILLESISMKNYQLSQSILLQSNINLSPFTKTRLSNITHKKQCQSIFKSTSLHLSCIHAHLPLISLILYLNDGSKVPNANGCFPIHLLCSTKLSFEDEDLKRRDCLKVLLKYNTIFIKDANKQTILHSICRSGHLQTFQYIIGIYYNEEYYLNDKYKDYLYWMDKWYRTSFHWCILHGNVDLLEILLQYGKKYHDGNIIQDKLCKFQRRQKQAQTSAAIETFMEMCLRLYSKRNDDGVVWENDVGKRIYDLLLQYGYS